MSSFLHWQVLWMLSVFLSAVSVCRASQPATNAASELEAGNLADLAAIFGIETGTIVYHVPPRSSVCPVLDLHVRNEEGSFDVRQLHTLPPCFNTGSTPLCYRASVGWQRKGRALKLLYNGETLVSGNLDEFDASRFVFGGKPCQLDTHNWILMAQPLPYVRAPLGWTPVVESQLQAYVSMRFSPGPSIEKAGD